MKWYFFLLLITIIIAWNCSSDDAAPPTCYRCEYTQLKPDACDSILIYEACIIGPHNNSLQVIMEITEICNDQISTSEDIGFIEDFLAIQQSNGAICEEL